MFALRIISRGREGRGGGVMLGSVICVAVGCLASAGYHDMLLKKRLFPGGRMLTNTAVTHRLADIDARRPRLDSVTYRPLQ